MKDVLVSSVPGRIRLRGDRLRHAAGLADLSRKLEALPGALAIETNARVGSVLFAYRCSVLTPSEAEAQLSAMLAKTLPAPVRRPVPTPTPVAPRPAPAVMAPAKASGNDAKQGAMSALAVTKGVVSRMVGASKGDKVTKAAQTLVAVAASPQATPWKWQRTANKVAKRGMLVSLGTSLGLAASGAKKGHAASGAAFVAMLGVHLLVHRKSVLK
ncbi:MAG: hypothetical protein Q4D19_09810 [Lautropia sp.]|nr:hypothetical protein [Lautropia sp.]